MIMVGSESFACDITREIENGVKQEFCDWQSGNSDKIWGDKHNFLENHIFLVFLLHKHMQKYHSP